MSFSVLPTTLLNCVVTPPLPPPPNHGFYGMDRVHSRDFPRVLGRPPASQMARKVNCANEIAFYTTCDRYISTQFFRDKRNEEPRYPALVKSGQVSVNLAMRIAALINTPDTQSGFTARSSFV